MFDDLGASGVELIGGPATHPILPLMATDFGLDLQLSVGRASHADRFGAAPGVWLPECAWDRGLDAALARSGVEHFCVDQSAALGELSLDNLEPIATPAGPTAMPIDWHIVAQVWREDGFPSTPAYRSTFARTIHDLLPYNNAGDGWSPETARVQAQAHAAASSARSPRASRFTRPSAGTPVERVRRRHRATLDTGGTKGRGGWNTLLRDGARVRHRAGNAGRSRDRSPRRWSAKSLGSSSGAGTRRSRPGIHRASRRWSGISARAELALFEQALPTATTIDAVAQRAAH